MQNNLPTINLIKNQQIPLLDKFLNWTLTVGRLIIIITEVVAVIAFVYRFSLDDRLVNLHSSIKQQQNIISVMKSDEDKYRNLQERISLASTFSAKGLKDNQTIINVMDLIAGQAKISNFTVNKDRLSLGVDVVSVAALSSFIDSLKGYHNIASISIDNIENKPSLGLSVAITAMLK